MALRRRSVSRDEKKRLTYNVESSACTSETFDFLSYRDMSSVKASFKYLGLFDFDWHLFSIQRFDLWSMGMGEFNVQQLCMQVVTLAAQVFDSLGEIQFVRESVGSRAVYRLSSLKLFQALPNVSIGVLPMLRQLQNVPTNFPEG